MIAKDMTVDQFNKELNEPYAWPGGYPRYFILSDGDALSFKAAKENADLIREAIASNSNDGWRVVAIDINWEDHWLTCSHTGELIESAYGEDENDTDHS